LASLIRPSVLSPFDAFKSSPRESANPRSHVLEPRAQEELDSSLRWKDDQPAGARQL